MNQYQDNILEGLSAVQRDAVVNYDGPTLIIAGAGSGKTRVLTTRIAYMLAQGVDPSSILALTFTNKAAREMRERIEKLVGPKARFIRMGTFHSVFARLLRENAERIGYTSSYTIYEPSDVKNLIKAINDLKARVGIKATIKDYGVDEADFLARMDDMVEQAYDDQCTGANPRYPLMSELKQMYLNAYYGNHFVEPEMPATDLTVAEPDAIKAIYHMGKKA